MTSQKRFSLFKKSLDKNGIGWGVSKLAEIAKKDSMLAFLGVWADNFNKGYNSQLYAQHVYRLFVQLRNGTAITPLDQLKIERVLESVAYPMVLE